MKGLSREEILNGKIIKGMSRMIVPLIFLSLINTMYSVVDTFWVGRMGEIQVGALSLIGPVLDCGNAFSTGLCAAAVALVVQSIGAGKKEEANRIATHLILLGIAAGTLIALLLLVKGDFILAWLKTPAEMAEDSRKYLIGISFDCIFLFTLNLFHSIRQSSGDTVSGVKLNTAAALCNIILDPILIFTCNLGVLGAALATVLSKAFMIPFVFVILAKGDGVRVSFKKYPFRFTEMKEIILVALPASFGSFLSSFGFVIMNKYIVAYGALAMSAYGIGNRISSIFYIPVYAIGSTLSTYIAQNLGAGQLKRCEECYRKSFLLMLAVSAVGTVIGVFSAELCIRLFVANASAALMETALEYTYYSICTAVFMGWYSLLCGVFDGSGKTQLTLILSTFRLWGIRIPAIILFQRFTSLNQTGIWWAMILSNVVICLIGQILYKTKLWQKKQAA